LSAEASFEWQVQVTFEAQIPVEKVVLSSGYPLKQNKNLLLSVHNTDEIKDAGDFSDKRRQQRAAQSISKAVLPFLCLVSHLLPPCPSVRKVAGSSVTMKIESFV
jgi:hypothetical protein